MPAYETFALHVDEIRAFLKIDKEEPLGLKPLIYSRRVPTVFPGGGDFYFLAIYVPICYFMAVALNIL
ncbi:hypothetical protein VH13_05950 [Corynebacterium ulcerans]|nr:hypothetical protein VH13_05950 [Corynebacterium ulcerans]KKO87577.1 hypothetical protein VH15_02235 [Corynebacterium ulcerans]KPJ24657.1 hypothetical protein AOT31_05190 [Corynebacterium ulcerans]BDV25806.1 hypothetical protein CULTSU28_10540 [Corynebacterium ulcerans]